MFSEQNIDHDCMLDGLSALEYVSELIQERKPIPKVLLIDFSMPGLDGPQTAIHIRELCKDAGRAVPYMACYSAYNEHTFKRIAKGAGMDVFYSKPIQYEHIQQLKAHLY
mmetsp:Transcript_16159/g.21881  ORF Transcript_16159/g.21881 Transcript_16159/m.21881 type:complete len:110 (-) Transcript_16159:52-381(-)